MLLSSKPSSLEGICTYIAYAIQLQGQRHNENQIPKQNTYAAITALSFHGMHWFSLEQRIQFQTCCLVYKVIRISQPNYLSCLLIPWTRKYFSHLLSALVLREPEQYWAFLVSALGFY